MSLYLTATRLKSLTRYGVGVLLAAGLMAGCSVLPNSKSVSASKWATYEDAKAAYEAVKIGVSTHNDIRTLGFDPKDVPNIKILNYVDVVNLFGPAFKLDDLPVGIKTCVKAKESCFAYSMQLRNISNKRDGNIPADLLGFSKATSTSGWEFNATLVLVNNTVVYKLWNGTPDIKSRNQESSPLGPMQNLGGVIPKPF